MLRLRFMQDGEERTVPLTGSEVRFGRSGDNEVVLPDYSVSRRHAALRRDDGDGWVVVDLKSTNGVQVNHIQVERSAVRAGDRIKIGVFELVVESDVVPPPTAPTSPSPALAGGWGVEPGPPRDPKSDPAISNATIVRSLAEFTADYGLDSRPDSRESSAIRQNKRKALDQAYASQVFGFLTRLAQLLIKAESIDGILQDVIDIAFDALPVDRGFILLRDEDGGELVCELVRISEKVEMRPQGEVPISKTMLEAVMREQVALLTYDALSDRRLAGTESVRIHQIRAAMCAPLWSGEKIIGVMQVDTPHHTGTFTENDIDLLAALANYCAVAIERIRNAEKADFERQVRSRLERYHSPGVIEQVISEDQSAGEEGIRRLTKAECTVLFADIVGFTAYSEKAQPEEVAEMMEGYFTHAVEAIFSAGGTLDKFIGDCVMAFFGAPVHTEDHATRAVQAAVRILDALDEWNRDREEKGQPRFQTRIAINTGPVVVGDIGSNRRVDYTVLGNTVNVAARLESAVAAPDEIVIGDATNRQLAGAIPTEALGEFQLKGLAQKIVAHRVIRDRRAPGG